MRAVIVDQYGASPRLAEVPIPEARAGQILIRVDAAGMNPMDRAIADGGWQSLMPATFPMVLGFDVAGKVEQLGDGSKRFSVGDEVFGQTLIPPLGSTGTYAEYVAVNEDLPVTRVPTGLDPAVAASAPTAGMTGLSLVELLGPLTGKCLLIVGAGGGVGSFATQFAVRKGARVIANVRANNVERMRSYGVTETVDHTTAPLPQLVGRTHPDGVDALIDLANDAEGFAALAALVRRGGMAVTTRYVADEEGLKARGVTPLNFQLQPSAELLQRLGEGLSRGQIVAPPINRVSLAQAPAAFAVTNGATPVGKTVIVVSA
jgi:NADPH2:quinone reductase